MTITEGEDGISLKVDAITFDIEDPAEVKRYHRFRAALDKFNDRDNLDAYLGHIGNQRIPPFGRKVNPDTVLVEVIESLVGWPEFWAWVASNSYEPPRKGDSWGHAIAEFMEEAEDE